jgi:hypothetical protein
MRILISLHTHTDLPVLRVHLFSTLLNSFVTVQALPETPNLPNMWHEDEIAWLNGTTLFGMQIACCKEQHDGSMMAA